MSKWRLTIEVVGEEQADEILEVLRNAEEEAEITFGFDTTKTYIADTKAEDEETESLRPLNTDGEYASTDTVCANHDRYNCGICN